MRPKSHVSSTFLGVLLEPLKVEPQRVGPKKVFTYPDLKLDPADYQTLHKCAVMAYDHAKEAYKTAKHGESLAHLTFDRARITLDEIEHAIQQYQRANDIQEDVVPFRLWACSVCGSSEVEVAGGICPDCAGGTAA